MGAELIAITEQAVTAEQPSHPREPGYLFGDSEPFPPGFDFVSALSGFVDLSVAVLSRAREAREIDVKIAEARGRLAKRYVALDSLMAEVKKATEAAVVSSCEEDFTMETVLRLERAVEEICATTRDDLEEKFQSERVALERAAAVLHAGMADAVRTFVLNHELEVLSQNLTADLLDDRYRTQLTQHMTGEISASFDLDEELTKWAHPRRVGDFVTALSVGVGARRSWFSRSVSIESRLLDDYVIGRVRLEEDTAEIGLRRRRDAPDTLAIHLAVGEHGLSAQIVRTDGGVSAFDVPEDTARRLEELWHALKATMQIEIAARTAVRSVTIDGCNALDPEGAELLIERLVEVYRPIIVEVARRSGSPNELSLKRTLSDGRREERYVNRQHLVDRLSALGPKEREKLASLPLGPEGALRTVDSETSQHSSLPRLILTSEPPPSVEIDPSIYIPEDAEPPALLVPPNGPRTAR